MCPARWGRWPWYPGKGAGHVPAGFLLCGVGDSWPRGSPATGKAGLACGTASRILQPQESMCWQRSPRLGSPKSSTAPRPGNGQEFNVQLWLPRWDGGIHRGPATGQRRG